MLALFVVALPEASLLVTVARTVNFLRFLTARPTARRPLTESFSGHAFHAGEAPGARAGRRCRRTYGATVSVLTAGAAGYGPGLSSAIVV